MYCSRKFSICPGNKKLKTVIYMFSRVWEMLTQIQHCLNDCIYDQSFTALKVWKLFFKPWDSADRTKTFGLRSQSNHIFSHYHSSKYFHLHISLCFRVVYQIERWTKLFEIQRTCWGLQGQCNMGYCLWRFLG